MGLPRGWTRTAKKPVPTLNRVTNGLTLTPPG
jgi:hypothetical protein